MKKTYRITAKSNSSGIALGRDGRGRMKPIPNNRQARPFKVGRPVFALPAGMSSVRN